MLSGQIATERYHAGRMRGRVSLRSLSPPLLPGLGAPKSAASRGNDEGMLPMTCCDPLQAECPLDLTEDDCRTLIRLLRHAITPDREPLLPQLELLSVILEKLEFAVGG